MSDPHGPSDPSDPSDPSEPGAAPIRTDTSIVGLRAAVVADFVATRLAGTEAPVEVVRRPDVGLTRTSLPIAIHNAVVYARFGPDDAGRRVREIVDEFRDRGVPFVWWVGPDDRPDDLVELAEAAGLMLYGGSPGMALPLDELAADAADGPDGLAIEPVVDEASLERYLDALDGALLEDGIGPPEALAAARPSIRAHVGAGLAGEHIPRRWVGRWDGRPVATARLSVASGAAGLYTITTHGPYRGRGIGRAMTVAPLLAARDAGYRVAVLQASPLGLPIYRRLGFREVVAFDVLGWEG